MRSARARYAATLVASAAAVVGCVLGSVPAASASGAPSWEPDPNAVATIAFFNAAGAQITSGSATASPMAAYAVATGPVESGDDAAILYAALPKTGENTDLWSVEQLSSATVYPATSAPAGIGATNPTVTGAATDESLSTFATSFPSSSGIYQIRMRVENTKGTGVQSAGYADADVQISGNTWTEVYPKGSTSSSSKRFDKVGKPVLSGKHKVGTTETSTHGKWAPVATKYTYQWFVGSKKIKGATRSSLKLTKSLKGKSIHCRVTATKSGYSKASASSKSVTVTK